MKSYKELKKEFEEKVKELQRRCKHRKSIWVEEWWAFAHSTGCQVRVCNFCNKILERRKMRR